MKSLIKRSTMDVHDGSTGVHLRGRPSRQSSSRRPWKNRGNWFTFDTFQISKTFFYLKEFKHWIWWILQLKLKCLPKCPLFYSSRVFQFKVLSEEPMFYFRPTFHFCFHRPQSSKLKYETWVLTRRDGWCCPTMK